MTTVVGAGAGLSTVFSDLIEQAEAIAAMATAITRDFIVASMVLGLDQPVLATRQRRAAFLALPLALQAKKSRLREKAAA